MGLANLFEIESSPKASFFRSEESGLAFISGLFSKGKLRYTNEDASFQTATALGIADGVSAWRESGIDGGQFARELMRNCRDIGLVASSSSQELAAGLSQAHSRVQAYGSSTALLGFLVGSHILFATLGDSRAIVLRWLHEKLTLVFTTEVSMHSFNCPYQLAHIPTRLNFAAFINDTSKDARLYSRIVEPGDLVIMGTDGLWDNLYDRDIIDLLSNEDLISPHRAAEMLGKQAYLNSKSTRATPFQDAVNQTYPDRLWKGGKADDITVLAALVV